MQDLIGGESSHLVVESQAASDARFSSGSLGHSTFSHPLRKNLSLPITQNSDVIHKNILAKNFLIEIDESSLLIF